MTLTVTKATRVTRLSTSLRKAIRAITTRRSTSKSMMRRMAKRKRSTKRLVIMVRSITARRVRKTRNSAKRENTRRDTVRKENTASSRRTSMRRNRIFMTSIMKTEETKNMVDGMKNMRARRVAMKRKGICMRNITRDITVMRRNTKEALIITRRKVTNRLRDTRIIMNIMRDMAIKVVTHQGTNFRNQNIIDERRDETHPYINNRRTQFAYIYFNKNFVVKSRLYIWNNIEWRISDAPNLSKIMITIIFYSCRRASNIRICLQGFYSYYNE